MILDNFPFYKQFDSSDCGPTCLKMIAKYHGKIFSIESLREKCFTTRQGTSIYDLSEAAENIGFRTLSAKIPFDKLIDHVPLPVILHIKKNHYVVLYKSTNKKIFIADPAIGKIEYTFEDFKKLWAKYLETETNKQIGIVLVLEPTSKFNSNRNTNINTSGIKKLEYLLSYIKPHKKLLNQIFLGLFISSLVQFIIPFLTQSLVDNGIKGQNINFVLMILISQLVLYISLAIANFIKSWMYLNISVRVNIAIISDYLKRLLNLKIKFFEDRTVGDILQRIGDNTRIEQFITGPLIGVIFSVFNLIAFSILLINYDVKIFYIFFICFSLYVIWSYFFLKVRKILDLDIFYNQSKENSLLVELTQGIQDIKLYNFEKTKRWEWEYLQANIFKSRTKMLVFDQNQQIGGLLILQISSALTTYVVATNVINGEMTFGMMLSVQYILGQLSTPVRDIITFITSAQLANFSLDRLNQIHQEKVEQDDSMRLITVLPESKDIFLDKVIFTHLGPKSKPVLNNISFQIPEGKITAIVGESGSGKTTLIKLLLKLYEPSNGKIYIGKQDLNKINLKWWRDRCGSVLQDSYLFSDTIIKNITMNDEKIDKEKLFKACHISNIKDFIESLPLSYDTRITSNGFSISQGQRQRILIARAIYNEPDYIFMDEATSFLDSSNEFVITNRLYENLKGKTFIIAAHRLSTVASADQIIVLKNGQIVEKGNHTELMNLEENYFELVKNQVIK